MPPPRQPQAIPDYQRGDLIQVSHAQAAKPSGRWVEAEVLFKARQFGFGMWQVQYPGGRQDTVHVSRMRLVLPAGQA